LTESSGLQKENDDLQERMESLNEELETMRRSDEYYQKDMIPEIKR
jgi:cell division protein FtsB